MISKTIIMIMRAIFASPGMIIMMTVIMDRITTNITTRIAQMLTRPRHKGQKMTTIQRGIRRKL